MNRGDVIFIEKAYMDSIYEAKDISRLPRIAFSHFMNYEDEILYILNEDKMAGVFSIGDLERYYNADSCQIKINSQYFFVNTVDFEEAERYFERSVTINELPVVTKNNELLGVIRKNKEDALRKKQRYSLRCARANCWNRKEIERFITHTKAKVILYTFSNEKVMSHWNDDTMQILKRRRENNVSDWKGLSDKEWKNFWQDEYEDNLVMKMKAESEECKYIVKNGKVFFEDKEGECYSYEGGYRVTRNNPSGADRRIICYGPCIIFGAYCKDNQTIEYYLQNYLNENHYQEWMVVNRGICGQENCYNQIFMEKLSENDIVVLWGECEWLPVKPTKQVILCRDIAEVFVSIPSLINYIVDGSIHCNYVVNQKIAETIFQDICMTGVLDSSKKRKAAEQIQDYYISWSVREYFEEYFSTYRLYREPENTVVGAIVMNCNPFTKGHRYLIEKAIEKVDKLYVFVVEEDCSYFKFSDRMKMVEEGIADLKNIHVIPSGQYILSKDTFAQYFEKEQVEIVDSMDYDVFIFGEIVASELGIRYRFVGEEPFDVVTREYNETMKRILPDFGVTVIEIPRCTYDIDGEKEIVSATLVREALQRKDTSMLEKLCPESTIKYLTENKMLIR